jgi:hypothetical protein
MRPPPWSAASFAVIITTLVHSGCAGSNRMEPLSRDSIEGGMQLDAIAPRERSAVISIRTRLHVIASASYASVYGCWTDLRFQGYKYFGEDPELVLEWFDTHMS